MSSNNTSSSTANEEKKKPVSAGDAILARAQANAAAQANRPRVTAEGRKGEPAKVVRTDLDLGRTGSREADKRLLEKQIKTGDGVAGKYSSEYRQTQEGKGLASTAINEGIRIKNYKKEGVIQAAEAKVAAERAYYDDKIAEQKAQGGLTAGGRDAQGNRITSATGKRPAPPTDQDLKAYIEKNENLTAAQKENAKAQIDKARANVAQQEKVQAEYYEKTGDERYNPANPNRARPSEPSPGGAGSQVVIQATTVVGKPKYEDKSKEYYYGPDYSDLYAKPAEAPLEQGQIRFSVETPGQIDPNKANEIVFQGAENQWNDKGELIGVKLNPDVITKYGLTGNVKVYEENGEWYRDYQAGNKDEALRLYGYSTPYTLDQKSYQTLSFEALGNVSKKGGTINQQNIQGEIANLLSTKYATTLPSGEAGFYLPQSNQQTPEQTNTQYAFFKAQQISQNLSEGKASSLSLTTEDRKLIRTELKNAYKEGRLVDTSGEGKSQGQLYKEALQGLNVVGQANKILTTNQEMGAQNVEVEKFNRQQEAQQQTMDSLMAELGYEKKTVSDKVGSTEVTYAPKKGETYYKYVDNTSGKEVNPAAIATGEYSGSLTKVPVKYGDEEFIEQYKPDKQSVPGGIGYELTKGAASRAGDYVAPLIGQQVNPDMQSAASRGEEAISGWWEKYAQPNHPINKLIDVVSGKEGAGYEANVGLREAIGLGSPEQKTNEETAKELEVVGRAIQTNPERFVGEATTETLLWVGGGKAATEGAKAVGKAVNVVKDIKSGAIKVTFEKPTFKINKAYGDSRPGGKIKEEGSITPLEDTKVSVKLKDSLNTFKNLNISDIKVTPPKIKVTKNITPTKSGGKYGGITDEVDSPTSFSSTTEEVSTSLVDDTARIVDDTTPSSTTSTIDDAISQDLDAGAGGVGGGLDEISPLAQSVKKKPSKLADKFKEDRSQFGKRRPPEKDQPPGKGPQVTENRIKQGLDEIFNLKGREKAQAMKDLRQAGKGKDLTGAERTGELGLRQKILGRLQKQTKTSETIREEKGINRISVKGLSNAPIEQPRVYGERFPGLTEEQKALRRANVEGQGQTDFTYDPSGRSAKPRLGEGVATNKDEELFRIKRKYEKKRTELKKELDNAIKNKASDAEIDKLFKRQDELGVMEDKEIDNAIARFTSIEEGQAKASIREGKRLAKEQKKEQDLKKAQDKERQFRNIGENQDLLLTGNANTVEILKEPTVVSKVAKSTAKSRGAPGGYGFSGYASGGTYGAPTGQGEYQGLPKTDEYQGFGKGKGKKKDSVEIVSSGFPEILATPPGAEPPTSKFGKPTPQTFGVKDNVGSGQVFRPAEDILENLSKINSSSPKGGSPSDPLSVTTPKVPVVSAPARGTKVAGKVDQGQGFGQGQNFETVPGEGFGQNFAQEFKVDFGQSGRTRPIEPSVPKVPPSGIAALPPLPGGGGGQPAPNIGRSAAIALKELDVNNLLFPEFSIGKGSRGIDGKESKELTLEDLLGTKTVEENGTSGKKKKGLFDDLFTKPL
jgi:hypothetical protein